MRTAEPDISAFRHDFCGYSRTTEVMSTRKTLQERVFDGASFKVLVTYLRRHAG